MFRNKKFVSSSQIFFPVNNSSGKFFLRKDAQPWSLDFIIAVFLFMTVVVFYFKYASEQFDETALDFEELQMDSEAISDSLLTQGYPVDWNSSNVKRIGICDNGYAINQTKLEQFIALSSDYNLTRKLFGTRNQYYFFITNPEGGILAQAGVNGTSSMLASAERVVLYNNTLYRITVYAWKS